MRYKLGSMFDGSGGFPLAGAMYSIEPVWASEIEPYPVAVTRERLPGMKHMGDISKINGAEIEPVDIITFGSPCQDLSVAGKRAGLKHESNGDEETTRSGLFMESVRIIKEMREATNAKYPRFAFWENVPGAFSSQRGEDLRIVLEELIKIAEPAAIMPPVPDKGWAYADSYTGEGFSLAYRVFDAQYWGVPQRRRRIHLILDLGGQCAGEILFKREGLRGYFETGRSPWQGIACNVEACTGFYDFERNGRGSKGISNDYKRSVTDDREGESQRKQNAVGFTNRGYISGDKAETCRAESHGAIPMVMEPVTFEPGIAAREGGHIYEGVSGTIRANAGDNRMAVCYDGRGNGNGEIAPTITGDHNNRITDYSSVVVEGAPVYSMKSIARNGKVLTEQSNPICASDYKDPDIVVYPVILDRAFFDQGQYAKYDFEISDSGVNSTLTARGPSEVAYWDGGQTCGTLTANNAAGNQRMPDKDNFNCVIQQVTGVDCRSMNEYPELYPTLQAKPNGGQSLNFSGAVRNQYIVRRLTPTECARLQGFPDWWGHIAQKDELTDEEYSFWMDVRNTHARNNGKSEKEYTKAQMLKWYNKLHTDSAEYKMWGNGIALPPALYCMQGIAEMLASGKTTSDPLPVRCDDAEIGEQLRLF